MATIKRIELGNNVLSRAEFDALMSHARLAKLMLFAERPSEVSLQPGDSFDSTSETLTDMVSFLMSIGSQKHGIFLSKTQRGYFNDLRKSAHNYVQQDNFKREFDQVKRCLRAIEEIILPEEFRL